VLAFLGQRITAIWVLLILATGLSWQFGHGFGFDDNVAYATVAILLISFVKIRFVLLDFMELRTAPPALRMAFEAWTVIVCATLVYLYWLGV
jgi:hypothetical protein